ncbi:MAG: hypothetical protein Q8M09_11855 [Pseudomonadota bacterium]|nr:hypothetical protein [Pseudomonadota bacterium]MDP1904924.1 hypothetical protein [Pseudomonadota bacterium]MDP2352047.1 hypothetical protein [Pseudomonadota bacterium]
MTPIETWKSMHTFQDQHHPIAMLVWLFSGLLSLVLAFLDGWEWANLWFPVAANIAITYLMLAMLSSHEAGLSRRIEAGNAVPWQVDVNGVIVGTITDSDYAAIQRAVWLDVRTYLAQLLNLGHVLSRIANTWFVAIPLGVFWFGLLCFFFAPNTFVSILAELQQVTPAQIASSTHRLLGLLVISSIMLTAMLAITGRPFGFTNCFDQAVNKAVRAAIECAADGDVFLWPGTSGMATTPAETDAVHPQKAI